MDLIMTLRICRLMVSRMRLAETDGAVWLFLVSSGATTGRGFIEEGLRTVFHPWLRKGEERRVKENTNLVRRGNRGFT
jgi:hypothetical protein